MLTIFDIKRFAVHDGPGIRTTVFLKGCPLRCTWCHNPESHSPQPEQYTDSHVIDGKKFHEVRSYGRDMEEGALLEEILRDQIFYEESGGGVTFSGGEPLMQADALVPILKELGDRQVHRAVDTCGYAAPAVIQQVAAHTDLMLYDLKIMDPARHMEHTGKDNRLILQNAEYLLETGMDLVFRVPVVPGINDHPSETDAFIEYFRQRIDRIAQVHLLPYHRAGSHKYSRLGKESVYAADTEESPGKALETLKRGIESIGILVLVGG